jgi:hypothetical protein
LQICCFHNVERNNRVGASDRKIRGATHVLPCCDALHPEYWVRNLRPMRRVSIHCFVKELPNIKVCMLNESICAWVVAANMNVVDLVSLCEVSDGLDKCGTVVGNYIRECTSSAKDVLENPVTYSLHILRLQHAEFRVMC